MKSSEPSSRSVAKRAQITGAARKLFLANGFAGTSMEAIADEAGVSKQTLYHHFATKVDLLGAVVSSELTDLSQRARLPASVEDPTRLRSVLLEFSNSLVKTVLSPDSLALIHLLVGEAYQIPSLRDSLVEGLPAGLFDHLTVLLQDLHGRGYVSAPRPELAARMLLGPVMSFMITGGFLRAGPIIQPSQADQEYIIDYFLTAMRFGSGQSPRKEHE